MASREQGMQAEDPLQLNERLSTKPSHVDSEMVQGTDPSYS
jgi:hypothetical protein